MHGNIAGMMFNKLLAFFAQILLGALVTPFLCEDVLCVNSLMQGTRITFNKEIILLPPCAHIDGIAGMLGLEHRTPHHTNLGLEDALH